METRLKLAGAQKKIFDDNTIPVIWEYSDQGVPRLINKVCKLCLKAGETNELRTISAEVAAQIGERFQRLSKTALQKRRPRSRSGPGIFNEDISLITETGNIEESIVLPDSLESKIPTHILDADPTVRINSRPNETSVIKIHHEVPDKEERFLHSGQEIHEEVLVGKHKIILTIPSHIMEQSKLSDRDSQSKLAGYWAAQIVKENPLLTHSPLVDPVSIWHELKDLIIKKINSNLITNSATAIT